LLIERAWKYFFSRKKNITKLTYSFSKIIATLTLKMWAISPEKDQSNFEKFFASQLYLAIFISKNIKIAAR